MTTCDMILVRGCLGEGSSLAIIARKTKRDYGT